MSEFPEKKTFSEVYPLAEKYELKIQNVLV